MYIRGAVSSNGASKWDASWKTVAFTDDKPATAGTADAANSLNSTVYFTGGNGNTTGYRLIGQVTFGQWSNYRCVMIVKGRHEGNGILSIAIGNNTNSITQANAYAEIKYWGTDDISASSYQAWVSSDGKTGYIFWHYSDYTNHPAYVISSDFTISNGAWMTSIGSGYGKCVATTQINVASTAGVATTGVRDYNNANNTIKIGWSGADLDANTLAYIAGYTSDMKIHTASKAGVRSWIGLGNYLPLSGGTMSGALNFANNTWNLVGDDAYMGDHNIGGAVCFVGANGGTKIVLCNRSNQGDYAYFGYEGGNILTNKTIAANITGTCATAAKLGRSGNTGNPMTFNWSGQSGQPTWLWGSNDGSNIYVWNPSNFSVSWANNAGNGVESSGSGYIRFRCGVQICWGVKGVSSASGTVTFSAAFNNSSYGVSLNAYNKTVDYGITIKSQSTSSFSYGKNGASPNGITWVAVGT